MNNYNKRRQTYDVFVGNIPGHASEVTIGQLFSCFGEIDRISLKDSKREGIKMAFVSFLCEPDADRAIRERNNHVYCGHSLCTSRATSWKEKTAYHGDKSGPPPLQKQPNYMPGGQRMDSGPRKFHSEPPFPKMSSAPREEQFVLTLVESPVTFYAQLLRQNQDLQQLARNLTEICPRQTHLASKPLPNKVYAARFSEDGQWYRCKVMSTDFYDKSYIRYIDYGNWELMAHTQMVSLPHNLASLPPLAPKCHLRNLKPVDKDRYPTTYREGLVFMQSQLQERILVATLHPQQDGSFEIPRLVLGDVDVHQHLLRYGYAFTGSGPPSQRPQSEFPIDLPVPPPPPVKRILDRPQPRQQPPLERVSANGEDLIWPGQNYEVSLKKKVEELQLQLSQEKGKVKAMTAQVQRLSEQKKVGNPYEKLEVVLEDVKRVSLLRQKVPILPGETDYFEEAFLLSTDASTPPGKNKVEIQRVLEGIEAVYGDLLKTRSFNNDSFPMQELLTYYRSLKQARKSKCVPLGAETDAARTALASAAISLNQALQSGEAFPCHFGKALEKLKRCLAQELAARGLDSSAVAVLAVMARLLKTALTSKLQEEEALEDLAQKLKSMPKPPEDKIPPTEPTQPPPANLEEPEESTEQIVEDDDSDDDGLNDLRSLRQKINALPAVASHD